MLNYIWAFMMILAIVFGAINGRLDLIATEALAAAMESKGFDEKAGRTIYHPVRMRPVDYAFPFLTTGLLVLGIVFL